MYQCICGKEFEKANSFNGHKSHCVIHLQHAGKDVDKILHRTKNNIPWNKGLTKDTDSRVNKNGDSVKNFYEKNPRIKGTPCHTSESKKRIGEAQSYIRRRKIREGTLTPTCNKRYVNCYIQYKNGDKKFLRSSYELIIAIFLDMCNVEFTYEQVRAPYLGSDGNEHSYISDFCINNTVLEIKGQFDSEKLCNQEKAFANIGYRFKILYEEDVFRIRDLLNQTINIYEILDLVKESSKNNNYYTYRLSF